MLEYLVSVRFMHFCGCAIYQQLLLDRRMKQRSATKRILKLRQDLVPMVRLDNMVLQNCNILAAANRFPNEEFCQRQDVG